MSTDRLDQLRALLAEEPGDVFLRYAIALELRRHGEMEAAFRDLESLVREVPGHVPSYYQLALMQIDLGRIDEASRTCEDGMLQSLVSGDRKAYAELQELGRAIHEDE